MMMKQKLLLSLLLLSLSSLQVFAQESEPKIISPIQIDRAGLSGLGLKPINLKQEPDRKFFQRNLFRGEDLSVYIVSSQSWTTRMENFSIDEYVYIFHGKSRAKADGGEDLFFQSGEHFAIPKGFTGEWEVKAADNIHYELSVITTQRAPEVKRSKGQLPKLFDKDLLSGIHIDWEGTGSYQEELFVGDELRISVKAEKARTIKIDSPAKEQLISLLSGHLILIDPSGKTHKFYAGDLFVIPKGFTGDWESQGHTLVKYLVIEQTN